MKICVTSQGDSLDSATDPRFGRCAYFVFVDTDTMEFEPLENSQAQAMGGAGPQAAKTVADKEAKVLLTGNVGPNAYQALNAGGIEAFTGISGTVKEAVEKYKKGELKKTDGPDVGSHFGMKGA